MKLRHVTSVGKFKCFSLQLVLVQQRNFRLQITIARWIHNYILLHSYATFDSNAIPIPSLTPYNWVFTANLGTPNGAGNVILQQATCVCLIGWELNQNLYECLQRIFIPCATCFYYFPLQHSCTRKPVTGSLIENDDPSTSSAQVLSMFKKSMPVLTETIAKHVLRCRNRPDNEVA